MKKTVIILSVFALIAGSCRNNTSKKNSFDLKTFPSEWRSMAEKDEKLVVNGAFTVIEIENSKLREYDCVKINETVYEKTSGFRVNDEILEAYQMGDTIVFTLENGLIYKFMWKNKEKGIGEWIFGGERGTEIYALSVKMSEYQIKKNEEQIRKKIKYYFKGSSEIVVFFDDGTAYESNKDNVQMSRDGYVFIDETLTERTWEGAPYREFPDFVVIGKIERFDFFDDFGQITPDWKNINYRLISSRKQITNFETNTEKIVESNIQNIKDDCLIFITPEQSADADDEYDPVIEWQNYAYDRKEQYEAKGIKSVDAEKRYLRFLISDDERIVIDTQKGQNGQNIPPSLLLYRKGRIPILLCISGESDEGNKMIEEYLQ